jgi:alkaline phosphatase D
VFNTDQWDGYQADQRAVLDAMAAAGTDPVVLTGDIHSSWCADLTLNPWDSASYNPQTGAGVIGAEFVCPAVTSPGPVPDAAADVLAGQLRFVSPHLKYINLNRRGYGVLDLTHERAACEIYHVATVDAKSDQETLATVMVSEAGNNLVRGEG